MKKIKFLIYIVFITNILTAQQTISSAGGDVIGNGGSSSYTIGQFMYTTIVNDAGSVAQGIQQSIEIYSLSNRNLYSVSLEAVIYPNPTSEFVMLSVNKNKFSDLYYFVYDLQGRLRKSGEVNKEETYISLEKMESGIFLFEVKKDNQGLRTFKLIKK